MTNLSILESHQARMRELLLVAEQDRLARLARLARQARDPRPLRRRVGRLLITAGQALVGQPSYTAYEEALAVADRSWS